MKVEEIKAIVEMMAENDLTEFKIEAEDMHLCIKRGPDGTAVTVPQLIHAPLAAPVATAAPAAGTVAPAEASADDKETIDSPIVGTFYRAPAPNADHFVEIGDIVKKGQTLCIIEAMKLMNEIESDADGVVTSIHVENGKPVEYGQKLFSVRTSA